MLSLSGTVSGSKKDTEVAWQNNRDGDGTSSGTDTWSVARAALLE
jgi:hypothetical protein